MSQRRGCDAGITFGIVIVRLLNKQGQTSVDKQLTAHPAFAAMEQRQAAGSLMVVQGFVGSSSSDVVRIYPFLSLARFIEIPNAGIVHVDDIADSGGMVRVFVDDSIEVTVTLTHTRVAKGRDVRRALPLENSSGSSVVAMAREKGVLTEEESRKCNFDCWIANPDEFFKQLKCESACKERESRDLSRFST